MVFEKLNSRKKSTFVLEQILSEISDDGFKVGDKLPPEEELAQMTGVSRTSVREALAALRLTGVVKSKAGKGTYLSKKPSIGSSNAEDRALSLLKKSASPAEMFEARVTIEKPIAELALERMDDSDLKQLEELLERMCEAEEVKDYESFLSLNRKFHLAIAQATGNTAIRSIMDSILSSTKENLSMEERRCYYENDGDLLERSLQIHQRIFNALKDRDKEAVYREIKSHYDHLKRGST